MKKMICCLALITGCYLMSEGKDLNAERQVAVVKLGEVFKIIYKSAQQSVVELAITNAEGNLVYSEKIESDGFIRPYNFSQLPRGDYNLSLVDAAGSYKETLCFEEGRDCQEHLPPESRKELMAGLSKVNSSHEDKYLLTIPHRSKEEVVIQVFDKEGNLLLSEVQLAREDFARVYNLKNVNGAVFHVTDLTSGQEKILPTKEGD